MSKNNAVLWEAAPHTIAKIEILKNYLNAWFPIVGSTFPRLVYVDGFAGPGKYSNHPEGSPIAALRVFSSRIAKDPERISISEVSAVFIEKSKASYEELIENIGTVGLPARVKPLPFCGEFADVMELLSKDAAFQPSFSGSHPLLVFADPFGGTGVPFAVVEKILGNPTGELLLNFDADGIARIRSGSNPNWQSQLDDVFGSREWEKELGMDSKNLARESVKVVDFYKSRLLTIPGVRFVWTFEMRGKTDRINYYLIFATRNKLGMEKMKEAMRAIDKTGEYCFSDAHVGQHILFRGDDVGHFGKEMHKAFAGRSVDYGEVETYALSESPFPNPKSMLEWLSRNGWIRVQVRAGEVVKAHTFPDCKISTIDFVEPPVREVQGMLL